MSMCLFFFSKYVLKFRELIIPSSLEVNYYMYYLNQPELDSLINHIKYLNFFFFWKKTDIFTHKQVLNGPNIYPILNFKYKTHC